MKMIRNDYLNVAIAAKRKYLRQFGRDEDGSIIVFTLILFIIMLVMGGMAVDFMRFENRRAELQSVADRASLAAAELDQELDAKDVMLDYFKKTGFEDDVDANDINFQEATNSDGSAGARTISVSAKSPISTFYLNLIGINTLTAPAVSKAIEGVGNIEISLVVDISGSMNDPAGSSSTRRIDALETAVEKFSATMLTTSNRNRVSISMVAYSQHTNLGSGIYNELNSRGLITERFPITGGIDNSGGQDGVNVSGNTSRCIDLNPADYTTTVFDLTGNVTYDHVETFQHQAPHDGTMTEPVCPQNQEGILPFTQEPSEITAFLGSIAPRQGTSIYRGAKWGMTLLDPSFRPIIEKIPTIDAAFSNRPSEYSAQTPENALVTEKYLVLLTDGENDQAYRINEPHYNTVNKQRFWSQGSIGFLQANGDSRNLDIDYETAYDTANTNVDKKTMNGQLPNGLWSRDFYTNEQGDNMLQRMCREAKGIVGAKDDDDNGETDDIDRMKIFTIYLGETPTTGGGIHNPSFQMQQCSSGDGFYFPTTGADGDLDRVFDAIAAQISQLRLSN